MNAIPPPPAATAVQKTTLSNGVRIVSEEMPHVRSVAVGIWIDRGSRHEAEADHGLSHFAEHMVFKGTEERSAEDIACTIDAIGGHLDAFTTKENVAFTAKVLDERLPVALDVVSDMTLRPAFRDDDIEKEKGVVLEELKMDEDNPDYLIHDLFSSNFWSGNALGRPIIGTKSSIQQFNQPQLRRFFDKTFHPGRLMVTAAGRLEHDVFVRQVEDRFGHMQARDLAPEPAAPQPTPGIQMRDKPSLEQVHLYLGVGAHPMADPRRFAAYVLSTLLGGGFSSRLFLKIRERAGLAYAVYSDLSLYSDAGCMSVYAGTSLEATPRVIEYVMREFRDLKDHLVPAEELRRAKDHLKGSLMLSLESTSSRMSNIARQEKYFETTFSLDDVVEQIEQVTAEQVRELAVDWFQQDRIAASVLGDLQGLEIQRDQFAC